MGDKKQKFEEMGFNSFEWASRKKDEYNNCESMEESISSINSTDSFTSSFSSNLSSSVEDLTDDASSSTSNSCATAGPLYELGDLMAQLPIKRGLSNFYHGKSQTFGSLANVRSVEDLAKKETTSYSCSSKMKSCRSKSYGGNLNKHKYFGPKATITKRRTLGAKAAIDSQI
ncbi:hypothetical protein ACJIZ3_018742 [Penstemon smallii]|uniref:Oxidative stress 3 n=1 Tax=Penstemon smallii TaxID=265156 RepID=A0ABD3SZA0_9LAMI